MPAAGKACRLRIFDQYPIHAKIGLQSLKVCQREGLPALLCGNLALPFGGELRNLTSDSRVFICIGQLASLGQCAEAVVVLARRRHVPCAEGEVGIGWGIPPDPIEGLQPCVVRGLTGKLKVGTCTEKLSLRIEHGPVDGQQKQSPAPDAGLQHKFAQKATADEHQEKINQMQEAHGLQGQEPDQGRSALHDQCD